MYNVPSDPKEERANASSSYPKCPRTSGRNTRRAVLAPLLLTLVPSVVVWRASARRFRLRRRRRRRLDEARVRERLVPEELRVGGVRRAGVRAHERRKLPIGVAVRGADRDEGLPELVRGLLAGGRGDGVRERVLDRRAVRGREVPGAVADVLTEFRVRLVGVG